MVNVILRRERLLCEYRRASSYIFYLVISSDSINEKVLMISVHH